MVSDRPKLVILSAFLSLFCTLFAAFGQTDTVVVRPKEVDTVLVNPGMGIQTFQRFRNQEIYPGMRWSEVGPTAAVPDASGKVDFPESSMAYVRWFWSQLEPEQGKYRWDIIDNALEEARKHGQTLMFRLMPYDQRNPLPEWYRNSGARRANKPTDKDGEIWSPDADDPLYAKHWNALVTEAGQRYDGHPYLDSVDVSTVGYWGEGWGPYLPSMAVQKALIDANFEAFKRTPLLMNFDEPTALAYGTGKGAGWRLDCWGDLGGRGRGMMHMLDMYPQQVVRTGIQDVWERSPVSLETCGTAMSWKQWGYSDKDIDYILAQALRWHASTINLKSVTIPPEWRTKFTEFEKKIGYRFVLRKLQYPKRARIGHMMPVSMWWLNAGVSPIYHEHHLAVQFHSASGAAAARVPVDIRKWMPGDAVYDGSLYVDHSLKPGTYRVRVAVLDPRTNEPAVRLAIEGLQPDGWYDLGEITLGP
ncbi:MAG TPA: DUF4832 domain-containing protein [Bryobacteraceae bacterium]|nr:DUF4832 domain-containing protein [Bryobacteraceae bacterium]